MPVYAGLQNGDVPMHFRFAGCQPLYVRVLVVLREVNRVHPGDEVLAYLAHRSAVVGSAIAGVGAGGSGGGDAGHKDGAGDNAEDGNDDGFDFSRSSFHFLLLTVRNISAGWVP